MTILYLQSNGEPIDVPHAKPVQESDVPTDLSPELASLFATLNELHTRAVNAITAHAKKNTGMTDGHVAQEGGNDATANPKAFAKKDTDDDDDDDKDDEEDDDSDKDDDDVDADEDEDKKKCDCDDYEIGADQNGELWFIAKRDDVDPKAGEKKYGDVPYADEKNKKYPLDADHVQAAWSYINMPKNASKYSPEDLASMKSKIKAAMKKHGHDVSDD